MQASCDASIQSSFAYPAAGELNESLLNGLERWLVWQVVRLSSSLSSTARSVIAWMASLQGYRAAAGCGAAAVERIQTFTQMQKCLQEQYRLPTSPTHSPWHAQRCHGRLTYTKRQQHVCRGFLDEISDFMNGGWSRCCAKGLMDVAGQRV